MMTSGLAERVAASPESAASFADILAAIEAGSPFLWQLVERDPARIERFAAAPPETSLRRIVGAQTELGAACLSGDDVARQMRRNRADHALLVALADLGGVWSLDEVTAALTAFADASVRSAVAVAMRDVAEGGRLRLDACGPDGEGCGLAVLAYGKHGAGELNYSSDIDLVVFFDPEAPVLPAGAEASRLFNRIAQGIVKLLSERTQDGYVHRVDYRLRPDPGSTTAAIPLPAAYTYYETVGQNWERAAMIKARPVAGDLRLGHAFLGDMEPFVWRKYFDFASIADIHAMKRQIHAIRGHDEIAVAGHDIKLGRGGIREIEFFVQTQQLVFGGRRTGLRGRRTLDMLGELEADSWIGREARDELRDAYGFLRRTEHRLQMVSDEQTQRLPSDETDLARFAAFAGYRDLAAFSAELMRHGRRVQHHYRLLFEDAPELASDRGDLVFTGPSLDPSTIATLGRLGFREPDRAAETVRGWHFGRRSAVTSARAREVLTELVPALLEALGGTMDPDGALARLDAAFGRMPGAVELLAMLRSSDRLRLLFADLLGSAPRLADEVAARPHLLDAMIDPGVASPTTAEGPGRDELVALIGAPANTEEFLDRLRDGARQMQFLTGARMLSGMMAPVEAGSVLAGIAEAAIGVSLDWVRRAFALDHGVVQGGEMVVLGLGRLGGRDLTATSDLDLVVLYDFPDVSRTSDGERPLDAVVYYTRLTQRLIAALTVPTRRGRLFEVDMRLRPSGTKGPVATQFSGFAAYHAGDAELWEQMALTRARVLAGSADLAGRTTDAIAGILRRPRDARTVYRGVRAMRTLVAQGKGEDDPRDLKLAAGGLLDLDFLAQAFVLAHASWYPHLVGCSTPSVLAKAATIGALAPADARMLAAAYRTLDDILHWQRLTLGDHPEAAEGAPAVVARLAGLVGCPDPGALRSYLDDLRRQVRALFERTLRGRSA